MFILITVIIVIVTVEGVSWLALGLLDKEFNIRYRPILTTQLSPSHEKALTRFIENDIDHTGFSATLGWTIKPDARGSV